MTELTRVAIATRKTIKYGVLAIFAFLLLRSLFFFGLRLYKGFFPDPPPEPTVAFGTLPEIAFPDNTSDVPNLILQTPSGELPVFPDQLYVYFMPNLSSNLFSLENAQALATRLGFTGQRTKNSDTQYTFSQGSVPSELKLDIVTGAFSISYDLTQDSSPFDTRPLAPEVSANNVKNFLSSAGLLAEDLTGPTTHEFLKRDGDRLVSAISLSAADFVKVNLNRKGFLGNDFVNPPLDNLPSVTPRQDQSNVWFIVSGARQREKQIIAGEYHYFPVDEEKKSTYPIKTAQQAWDELKAGNAFIAGSSEQDGDIAIRRVYLAYYDPGVESSFLQPIVVFEGDGGFVAYVSAVTTRLEAGQTN